MKPRVFNLLLIALAIGGLLVQNFTPGRADNSYIWDEAVKFKPVAKANRKRPASRPKVNNRGEEVAPLLTLKYRVLKRSDAGPPTRVSPKESFEVADQLKLAITANQNGFLYIVHSSKGTDGQTIDSPRIVFPDPRINDGSNVVEKDKEIVIPRYCAEYDNPEDCWWEITPPAGRDYFTLIFSRDEINSLATLKPGSPVDQKDIDTLKSQSGQKLGRVDRVTFNSRRTEESDGTYVRNTNVSDNEELIETIELAHLKETADDAVVRTRALFVKKRADAMRVVVLQGGNPVVANQEFREGEEIKIKFQSNFEGYVYILNITPGGKKRLLYPCSSKVTNTIIPGRIYSLPPDPQTIAFDEEKGTEVLQVIMTRERIKFLDDAVRSSDCCDFAKPCDLTESASTAAAELAGATQIQQQVSTDSGGIAAGSSQPEGSSGLRSRGIKLASGKDKDKSSYVAIQDSSGETLKQGQVAVFYIRLKHI
ncbi:MAG TPA: DUF4384 domain-containing protein [Blastocatellia bacterium]|nr:DUF4384 domain-containing protein [Blastocatellia bacterium]